MSTAATRNTGRRRAKAVLISVIGLHLVAETALTPFLPRLFERLYGIEDPGATGLYLWICRIAGLAALPLWGVAARRWPLHRLVLAGLCGSAVVDLLLGMAPSYLWYTVLSTAVVATNSALLLAYPAFVAEHGDDSETGERARLAGICSLVVVFHLSTVVATLVGAGVLALPRPRIGISAFAVLDLALAWLTHRVLVRTPATPADTGAEGEADSPAPRNSPAAQNSPVSGSGHTFGKGTEAPEVLEQGGFLHRPSGAARLPVLVCAALIGVAFDFSVNVARPFFTEFAEDLGSGAPGSAVLFFLPSVAALAVLPAVRRLHGRLGDRLLPVSLAVAAAGLLWQALASSPPALAGGRLLFGLGLGLGQVAVELRVFRATGTRGPAFTAVETARSAALLAAPPVAAVAVSRDLALPIALAAAVQMLATVLSLHGMRPIPPRSRAEDTGAAVRHPPLPTGRQARAVRHSETLPAPRRPQRSAAPTGAALPASTPPHSKEIRP